MKDLDKRVAAAIAQAPNIIASETDIEQHLGTTTEQMDKLGLTKRDLKWLERNGLAVRAYSYNGQLEFKEITNGVTGVKRNFTEGSKTRWILLAKQNA